jgi:hypothetical protein
VVAEAVAAIAPAVVADVTAGSFFVTELSAKGQPTGLPFFLLRPAGPDLGLKTFAGHALNQLLSLIFDPNFSRTTADFVPNRTFDHLVLISVLNQRRRVLKTA